MASRPSPRSGRRPALGNSLPGTSGVEATLTKYRRQPLASRPRQWVELVRVQQPPAKARRSRPTTRRDAGLQCFLKKYLAWVSPYDLPVNMQQTRRNDRGQPAACKKQSRLAIRLVEPRPCNPVSFARTFFLEQWVSILRWSCVRTQREAFPPLQSFLRDAKFEVELRQRVVEGEVIR